MKDLGKSHRIENKVPENLIRTNKKNQLTVYIYEPTQGGTVGGWDKD